MSQAKKLVFTLCFLLTFSSLAKEKLEVILDLSGVDSYAVAGNILKGTNSIIDGEMIIRGRLDGQSFNVRQGIRKKKVPNQVDLTILNKNTILLVDTLNGIKAEMRAKVKKSLTGKLKGLKISSKEYLATMEPVLERTGLSVLQDFQISDDTMSLETDLQISDINCKVSDEIMDCESDVVIKMVVEEK